MTPAYVVDNSEAADTMQGNAYLIAAAPDLLAAAKKAAEFLKSDEPISERQFMVLVALSVAVERAEGAA